VTTPPINHRPLVPVDHVERLSTVADALVDIVEGTPGPPELVGLVDLAGLGLEPGPSDRPDTLTFTCLHGPDPIGQLLGLDAVPEWWAVGVAASSTARPLDGGRERWPVTFVHLVARDGTTLDLLDDGHGTRHVTGPDHEVHTGRVPDLCRRMLGLPTAPPAHGLVPMLVDLWLRELLAVAADRPELAWADAAALHPAARAVGLPAVTPSPAELVRASEELTVDADWGTWRRICIRQGADPSCGLDATSLRWLDDGSFARWVLGESIPWADALGHLDAVLPRDTADKVFATVRLSPAPAWPPGV
jgi:hypothetical protein